MEVLIVGHHGAKYSTAPELLEATKPDVAVISNIGDAHIEFLGSREGILKAKCEIFENLNPAGVAVINGDDIRISFNADYINDCLKLIKSPEFTLSLNGPLNSAGIRTESEPNFVYIVTPVRS